MGGVSCRHSQPLMDFVSAECQVEGNLVTLVKRDPDFSTQRHRLRGVGTLSPVTAIQTVPETTRRLMVWQPKIFFTALRAVGRKHAKMGVDIYNIYAKNFLCTMTLLSSR